MNKAKSFLGYFYKYLFHSKTRQKLIFLAVFGLFLSSMALIVIQGVMNGLQGEMIKRSKKAEGSYILRFLDYEESDIDSLMEELKSRDIFFTKEIELELLGRHDGYIAPIVLRGIDFKTSTPKFLEDLSYGGVVLGEDLSFRLKSTLLSSVTFFSPAHVDLFFGEVPRVSSEDVSDIARTNVQEVDSTTAWVRSSFIHNLIRERSYNLIRIYDDYPKAEIISILDKTGLDKSINLMSWEDSNPELLWAFNLESVVMLVLFVCMCFLVSITIVAGNLIFFNKIKFDLISFWILGLSKKTISFLMFLYFQVKALITCLAGLLVGGLVLYLLKLYAPDIMPNVFLERSLPVNVTTYHILVAFFVPYSVASLFSLYALITFNKENSSYIELIRKVGE